MRPDASARETGALRRTFEEADVELLLERMHLARQRGLRDAEPARGGDEGRLFGDGDEITQVPQLHGAALRRRGPPAM